MSGQRDLLTSIAVAQALAPAEGQTGALVGEIIDTRDADSHTMIATLANLGAGETATLTINHGDDAALADGAQAGPRDVLTGETTTNYDDGADEVVVDGDDGEKNGKIGYVGSKRYIQLGLDLGAGTADVAAVLVSGHLHQEDYRGSAVS